MLKINLTGILLLLSLFSYAVYDYNQRCVEAYNHIICLQFNEGRKILEAEKIKNPKNDIPYYIENYIDFLTLFLGEKESDFEKLKGNKEKRIKRLEKGDKSSPYYLFCLAEINFQWASARMKFNERITAVYEANKAYRLLKENQKKFPDFAPNSKLLGVFHAFIGTIPDDYKWVAKIVSLKGTIEQGLKEMITALNTGIEQKEFEWLNHETLALLIFTKKNISSDKTEILELDKYFQRPDFIELTQESPLFCCIRGRLLMDVGSNDKAIEILENAPRRKDSYPFYFLDYVTGMAKLRNLENDAYSFFFNYVLYFEGKNYIKAAYQKIAWNYLINGNKDKYREYIARVLKYGDDVSEPDKEAKAEALSNIIPDVSLLKARLLFDGQYYERAIESLDEKQYPDSLTRIKDKIELVYRYGRIYHEWAKYDKAIPYYKETIKIGESYAYYFTANACVKIGNIYENKMEYKQAKYYYKKCLSVDCSQYKNSIHIKAKAGLSRLKNR